MLYLYVNAYVRYIIFILETKKVFIRMRTKFDILIVCVLMLTVDVFCFSGSGTSAEYL